MRSQFPDEDLTDRNVEETDKNMFFNWTTVRFGFTSLVRRVISPMVTMPEPNPILTLTARGSDAGEACESPAVGLMVCVTYEQSPSDSRYIDPGVHTSM